MAKEKSEKEISITEAFKQVKSGKMFPVYLIYGEEHYLLREFIDLIIENSIPPDLRQLNIEKFSCLEVDSETITTSALSIPMLSEKKIVIVKSYEKINDSKALQYYLQNPSQTTIVILICDSLDKRKSIFTKVYQNGIIIESAKLKKTEIIEWIAGKILKYKKKISPKAAEILVDLKGDSLQEILTEIEKLVTFCGERTKISEEDVLNITGSSREYNIFELLNSLGKNDKTKTIQILENLLNQNVEPIFIISMLTRHFILLWKTHKLKKMGKNPNEIALIIQVNPFFVKDYISQTEKLTLQRVEESLRFILESDLLLKSTSIPKRIVIENLIGNLLSFTNENQGMAGINIKSTIEI